MIFFLAKLLTGLICFASMAIARNMPSCPSEFWSAEEQHCRVSLRHIERGGIGYDQGYTSIDAFIARDPEVSTCMPFLDLRAHVFDNGKMAANVGVGLRKLTENRVYGFNIYYDFRSTYKKKYNQLGFGFESLADCWGFRLNGYLPIERKITPLCQAQFARFFSNHMIISQKSQCAMSGVQAELEYHFGKSQLFDFYAAAGAYYFTSKLEHNVCGGKGRLGVRCKEYWTFELSDSYDKQFHNRFQGKIVFTLPFGSESDKKHNQISKNKNVRSSCDESDELSSRMVQPVERQEIVVVAHKKKCSVAIDPATGQPYNFVFVDNTSHSLGTYESPYPTLALAQANSVSGDIIYVFPGDGTTAGMDEGITLKFKQNFWGSGIDHALQTPQGNLIIPAQSSAVPKITNLAGDGITLDSVNQVSGFMLTNVLGNGIFGANVSTIDIADCTIDNSQSDHIHLEYSGSGAGSALFNRLTLINGGISAIFINATNSSMACSIRNCVIEDNAVFPVDASFANQASVGLMNNTIERNLAASSFNFNGPSTLTVYGNAFNDNLSINLAPLLISAGASPISATINNNNFSGNVCGGIHFVLNDTDAAQLTVNGNMFTNNGRGSIGELGAAIFMDPNGSTGSTCFLNLTGNIFSGNSASSLYCYNGGINNFDVNALGNTIRNNGSAGFVFDNGGSSLKLAVINNVIANGLDHGITTAGGITITTADITISNNQITDNGGSACAVAFAHEGTDFNLNITNNNLSRNDTSGILIYSSAFIENVAVNIANNTINNNQNLSSNVSGGIDLEQYTNLSGFITNNTLSNNVGPDLFIGSTDPAPVVCVEMRGNQADGNYLLSNVSGTFNLAPCDVDAVNIGTIIPIGTITPVQSCPSAIPCPP